MRRSLLKHRILSFGLATTMVMSCISGLPSKIEVKAAENESRDSIEEQVKVLLEDGNYEKGEVIALVKGGYDSDKNVPVAQESEIELISSSDAAVYEDYAALDENIVNSSMAAGAEDFGSTDIDEVTLVHIVDKSKSTKELLTELLSDENVLMAEPNRTYTVDSESDDVPSEESNIYSMEESNIDSKNEQPSSSDETEVIRDETSETEVIRGETSESESEIILEEQEINPDEEYVLDNSSEDSFSDPKANSEIMTVGDLSITSGETSKIDHLKDVSAFQWGYSNDGTFDSTTIHHALEDFDMNAPGWNDYDASGNPIENATGVVAILDTGIDYEHAELKNIVMNDMRKYNDIGGNHGYSPADSDHQEPMDYHGHGTHCAGIIAGQWDHAGISGIANGCKIVSVKISVAGTGAINLLSAVQGYEYLSKAVDNGLKLVSINNSWGGRYDSDIFSFVAYELGMKGAISVFASGNENIDMDVKPGTVNSMSHNPFVIAVNSANATGNSSGFSNYGKYTTDVYAPGSFILSSVPRTKSTFLAETDPNPAFYEGFHEDETDMFIGSFPGEDDLPEWWTDPTKEIEKIDFKRRTDFGYEHNDAIEINMEDLTNDGDQYDMIAYLPVDKNRAGEIEALSLGMTSDHDYFYETPEILVETEDGYEWFDLVNGIYEANTNDWNRATFNFNDTIYNQGYNSENLVVVPTDDPEIFLIPLRINLISTFENQHAYLDQISLHTKDSEMPIAYMSGTSMATPAVTGAASIVAKEQIDRGINIFDKDVREQAALERANFLKGHIRHFESFEEKCRQGGMVDFSVEQCTPVINSTILEGNTLRITGAYFGTEEGKITLDQNISLSVLEWNDKEIFAEIPEGLKSNGYTIQVMNDAGMVGRNTTEILTDEESLFEKEIPLPYSDELHRKTVALGKVAGCNGKLYLAYNATADNGYRQLWSYDLENEEWTRCKDLPNEEVNICAVEMLETKCGMLVYITWNNVGGYGGLDYYQSELYLYDYQKDQYKKLTCKDEQVVSAASMISFEGEIYLVGGELYYQHESGQGINDANPIFNHVHIDTKKNTWSTSKAGDLKGDDGYLIVDGPAISACGDAVYIADTLGMGDSFKKSVLLKAKMQDGHFVTEDMSDTVPVFDQKHVDSGSIGIEATKDGLFLLGRYLEEPLTSVFYMGYEDEKFEPYGKEVYPSQVYNTRTCQYNAYLYVIGRIEGQSGVPLILRGTKVNTSEEILPKLHNTWKKKVTVKASLEEDGYIGDLCSVCHGVENKTVISKIESVELQNAVTVRDGVPCYYYTGKQIKPKVVVKDSNGDIISEKYYSVKYADSKKVGTASCEVVFKGLYTGSVVKKYGIIDHKKIEYTPLHSTIKWIAKIISSVLKPFKKI